MKTIITTGIFLCFLFTNLLSNDLTKFVDPFIGTGGHGHTFPGATMPFGMVQLSPDTDIKGWDWCSGYHESDNSIMGFSHTHLSGTGGADYGDILLMRVVGEAKWIPGPKNDPDKGYRSRFSHDREAAKPGYYQVWLDDYNVNVELTTTKRAGFHKYTFPESKEARILVDLKHGISDRVRESALEVISDTEIQGLRRSSGWANDQYVYFYLQFSKPFKKYSLFSNEQISIKQSIEGKDSKVYFTFETKKDEAILVKVGISAVSTEGAKRNLDAEIPAWSFDEIVNKADQEWNQWLNKIIVDGKNKDDKIIFYTALYHSLIAPNLYMDVDGKYRGRDLQIHEANGFDYYSLFSLWDTFRATHPLFTLIAPNKNQDFIKTMIVQYEQGGDLPIWELAANETGTMIGYHSVPVIVDAYMKNQRSFDIEKAFAAMKNSSMRDDRGLKQYRELGYIPADQEVNSVSKAVEYAYDDWCIATMASSINMEDDYNEYIKRSQYYLNHFDPQTKFMRGRMASGLWRKNFDPRKVSHLGASDFTEGNSWQYSFFAPHQVNHLIELNGGRDAFIDKLDKLFNEKELLGLEKSPDVSGLIGNYAHGNEPSHHIAYLYNYAGSSYKTQHVVNKIKKELYTTGKNGLSGNEDCGQMSAWYVFSAMGFYPVCPGQPEYVIGTPTFDRVVLNTKNNTSFEIVSEKESDTSYYINSTRINSIKYEKNYIKHSDIEKGGKFEFLLVNEPNSNWGNDDKDIVKSKKIEDGHKIKRVENNHVLPPYFDDDETLFSDNKTISLGVTTSSAQIYYTTNGDDPNKNSKLYVNPFEIDNNAVVKARAFKEGLKPSALFKREFIKVTFSGSKDLKIDLLSKPDKRYNKGGKLALLDGKLGSINFHDGRWLGFEKTDLVATIDLGQKREVSQVSGRFLRGQGAWIFYPTYVECLVSQDGINYESVGKTEIVRENSLKDDEMKVISVNFPKIEVKLIRLIAKNLDFIPAWHGGVGGKAWLFIDEIMIKE